MAGEDGPIHKDWGGRLPVALAFPNAYYLGMSSLAIHTLYRLFNDLPNVVCERVFWGERNAPKGLQPALSIESQRPLVDFPVIAFSISYELDYLHVVQMLRAADIPVERRERDESWPLVIAGGPAVCANPLPLSDFVDAFAIGEAEAILPGLMPILEDVLPDSRPRALEALAAIPGIYVPGYSSTPVSRLWLDDLSGAPSFTQVYSQQTEFGDRGLIEIGRGCARGCRFCMAGFCYRPLRSLPPEAVLDVARGILRHRRKVGLVSAAVSDYPEIDRLAAELRGLGAKISVSSLRLDPLPHGLLHALAESGTQTLTVAPEAGSWRLRQVINKRQTDDQILRAVSTAASLGFPQLKMYFMVGHPTETDQDIDALIDLVLAARGAFPRNLTITTAPFVPKPHTPFQWAEMTPVTTTNRHIKRIESRLRPAGVEVRHDSPEWAVVEGVLARGDERLGRVLGRMSEWRMGDWNKALREQGLSSGEFIRLRHVSEQLPWAVVDMGVQDQFLRRESARGLLASDDHIGAAPRES